ncbi:protein of unknown function [Shewanella benthica]|uniref:Uncharacterized protein n=1 Tax=Shewanella benthica TaxID=43661 RepID=A0A330LXK8_9GAMM|nr:protein of unknown function [Shewanella benthica]
MLLIFEASLIRPPTINQQHNAPVTSFQFNVQQSTVVTDTTETSVHYNRRTGNL